MKAQENVDGGRSHRRIIPIAPRRTRESVGYNQHTLEIARRPSIVEAASLIWRIRRSRSSRAAVGENLRVDRGGWARL